MTLGQVKGAIRVCQMRSAESEDGQEWTLPR